MSFDILVFPSDYFSLKEPDEHFAAEAKAAQDMGYSVVFYDHEKIVARETKKAVSFSTTSGTALMRGWMLQPHDYEFLFQLLAEKNIHLSAKPDAYKKAHTFPGWHALFADWTACAVWTDNDDADNLALKALGLPAGRGVLKDHVKSVKNNPDALFVENVHNKPSVTATVQNFVDNVQQVQGGLVLRSWQEYVSVEWRSWWIDGEFKLLTPHPDTPGETPQSQPPVQEVAALVARLDVPFVTLDWVLRADDTWHIVEVGSGSVSDRPTSVDATDFLSALL